MLKDIFDKNNCDKGTVGRTAHHYHTVYENDFSPIKEEPINILEVGIWKGTSHKSWLEYFPNAQVYGIDIFTRIEAKEVDVLKEERMHWIKHNSTRASVKTAIKREWGEDLQFDIIIDDGKHTPDANTKTLKNLMEFLKEDGAYYVEDVFPLHIMTEEEKMLPYLLQRPDDYNLMEMNKFLTAIQDYNVETFDLREKTKKQDSFIYRLKK